MYENKQRGLFGALPVDISAPMVEVCRTSYDHEVTIFTEALIGTGVPGVVEAAESSHYISGEGWRWCPIGLTCKQYLARFEDE